MPQHSIHNIPIYITCYNVYYTPTAPHSSALAYPAYGRPPTHKPNTHVLTHTHTVRCQGLLSPCLSQCYLQVGVGFPFSDCGILSEQETALLYMVGYFLWLPLGPETQWFFDFFNDVCMSQKMYSGTWYPVLRDMYHPEDDFLIMLHEWDDFQVRAELVGLNDLKEKFTLKSFKISVGNVTCMSWPISFYGGVFVLIHVHSAATVDMVDNIFGAK